MLATGGLLIAIAVLTLAAVAPVFRRDNPPRWTTRGWIGELVTLAIVCTLALGVGYFGAGAIDAFQTGPDYLDLSLLAGVLLVAAGLGRALSQRARSKPVAADARVHGLVPGAGQAHSDILAADAEPEPVSASAPPPPHRAA